MLKLLSIEFFKLRNTKYFWVLSGLFSVFLLSVPIASKALLDYIEKKGGKIVQQLTPGELPLFDFVDIWQNLTWVYMNFSLFLGFIMVISICNEFSFGTIKQNIIDGMSRREFLWSKISLIIGLSVVFSFMVFIIGLIMGFMWSPVKEFTFIISHIEFIPAYCLHLIAFQLFCLVVSLLVKRSGIVIALLTFYVYVIEPIATSIIQYYYKLEWLANLFPAKAMGNIIPLPFGKYILQETQTTVGWDDLGILVAFIALFLWIADWVMKRDLR